ncbi:alkaline phosphatase D family protein [uncultured Draconibacterium sp.]|uniref:alkaline phosphatase D family protein n=1 Tax=uncultured Draconibacterium sp. TaxID=1573823 RepID=UPI0025E9D76F|nr:alkaline phosphatase D family protein [uncultured Draconibacterium sp.]
MKSSNKYKILTIVIVFIFSCLGVSAQLDEIKQPKHKVTLKEAHVGNQSIDEKLQDSYLGASKKEKEFFLTARSVFAACSTADFTNEEILAAAKKNNIKLLGGPMLGKLTSQSVEFWLRPAQELPLSIVVSKKEDGTPNEVRLEKTSPGVVQKIEVENLFPNTEYQYTIVIENNEVANGSFTTAPSEDAKTVFKLAFGSCFHKIGIHNPNLVNQIMARKPQAMLLLGDIAVDDRENNFAMHRSDYLLRDLSTPWQQLVAQIPVYTAWDDHDYLNNDLSGIPEGFSTNDRDALRNIWKENWNNPENVEDGIYFSTRLGPVEIIMLDTRSCRTIEKRGEYASFLGEQQQDWLKNTLKNSTAPFKVISSGTMWSDDVSNGKDSWGTWDTAGREELFSFIEKNHISGVVFLSGDRHGARAFRIPRENNNRFYEFQVASLGGVPGPDAMAPNPQNQLFGYHGEGFVAFGELSFDTTEELPILQFSLTGENGAVLEQIKLTYDKLTPQ